MQVDNHDIQMRPHHLRIPIMPPEKQPQSLILPYLYRLQRTLLRSRPRRNHQTREIHKTIIDPPHCPQPTCIPPFPSPSHATYKSKIRSSLTQPHGGRRTDSSHPRTKWGEQKREAYRRCLDEAIHATQHGFMIDLVRRYGLENIEGREEVRGRCCEGELWRENGVFFAMGEKGEDKLPKCSCLGPSI